ncbi:MAG: hypothetical protein DMG00_19305 [Acidobacteria bacterium]|nr:MAG: hypothetical protein DMG00_19305 [Acidobacteriota bacterium]
MTLPGAIASNRTAASRPVPVAPVASAARASVMSMRFPFTCCVKVTLTPPARMNVPSFTLRTRSFVASNVSVSVSVERRVASVIEIGTVYGPPPTRNVGPGGDRMICADPMPGVVVGPGATGSAAGGVAVVGAGVAGAVVGAAGAAPGGAGVGAGCAAGSAGTATTFGGVCCCGCGTGTVPGTGVDPGGSATGCPLGPRMVPGVVEPPYAGCAPAGGAAGVPGCCAATSAAAGGG